MLQYVITHTNGMLCYNAIRHNTSYTYIQQTIYTSLVCSYIATDYSPNSYYVDFVKYNNQLAAAGYSYT